MRLIDITRRKNLRTIGTTEDTVNMNRGVLRHIHRGTTGDTFLITATIGSTHLTTHQVDDGRGFVEVETISKGFLRFIAHAKTIIGTGTENLSSGEIHHTIGDVNKHITMILRLITSTVTRVALSSSQDFLHRIVGIGVRTEIDKGIMQVGTFLLTILCDTRTVYIIVIVIVTETTTKNTTYSTLRVLHIGRRSRLIGSVHHRLDLIADVVSEVALT